MMDPIFSDFPKADAVERGCGEREAGGVYAECGLSNHGLPLEAFLLDPPLPIPDGLDLVNKPQLWQRMLPSGEPIRDRDGQPIHDVLIWVGAEHYPYVPDYLEEVRRYGASRKLNPNLDLSLLSRESRMILAHPKVINMLWQEQRPPQACGKHVPGHAGGSAAEPAADGWDEADEWDEQEGEQIRAVALAQANPTHSGPCLFKTWELLPPEAAETTLALEGEACPLCLRRIGSATYQYRPTGEAADGLVPGLFAALPLTGFALIQFADGTVNEKAKQKILSGMDKHGSRAVPFYESDR